VTSAASPAIPAAPASAALRARVQHVRTWVARVTLLQAALALSVAAHAVVLATHFEMPKNFKFGQAQPSLDVILVNARSDTVPDKPDALAQANLDGGGDRDKGRASSPLPKSARAQDGDDVNTAQQRVAALEQEQRKLMSSLRPAKNSVSIDESKAPQPVEAPPNPNISGIDLAANSLAMALKEAEIKQRIEDYNKIPKRKQITPSTRAVAYAQYYSDFVAKVEKIGRQSFPDEARGIGASSLVMVVTLKQDGTLYGEPEIVRPSEHQAFNKAAISIINKAGRFGKFTDTMIADCKCDLFEIVATWRFSKDGVFDSIQTAAR
jgi:periplasmic protein TonB